MAYFVAKELSMRPMTILTNWNTEELLVAFAYYANINSKQSYDMMDKKERAKKHMTQIDRWAIPFVSEEQAESMSKDIQNEKKDVAENMSIAKALFG